MSLHNSGPVLLAISTVHIKVICVFVCCVAHYFISLKSPGAVYILLYGITALLVLNIHLPCLQDRSCYLLLSAYTILTQLAESLCHAVQVLCSVSMLITTSSIQAHKSNCMHVYKWQRQYEMKLEKGQHVASAFEDFIQIDDNFSNNKSRNFGGSIRPLASCMCILEQGDKYHQLDMSVYVTFPHVPWCAMHLIS